MFYSQGTKPYFKVLPNVIILSYNWGKIWFILVILHLLLHILLCWLHWLPVRYRVEYKVLMFVFKAINGLAPAYLSELLTIYKPARTLAPLLSEHLFDYPQV